MRRGLLSHKHPECGEPAARLLVVGIWVHGFLALLTLSELTETLCIRLCRSRGGEGSLRGRSLSGGADFEAVFDGEGG